MELLCPAGSQEALRAAVQNGADAVYMAFGAFNARRNAKNFTEEEFSAAVAYCHLHGVKVYLTVNILVTDRELTEAAHVLHQASQMGVDAVLIQDWGVWHLAREIVPDLPLHASTQMSLHTLGGARLAAQLGLERVVLARELSAEDVAVICRGCGAQVEVFGHGALCMCYSGQCAMSALIGGRSGNRGRCAQPCRLPYGVNQPCGENHPLSLKDANLSAHLRQMEEMGVASLKLEGRMKRPEYVAVITGIYRRLLDEGRSPRWEELRQLEQAFSRSGFADCYWQGKKGPQMFGVRPENTPEPKELFQQAAATYDNSRDTRLTPVDFDLQVHAGEPVRLRAFLERSGRSYCHTVTGPVPEPARNRALTEEELAQRLAKTGGTAFSAGHITISLEEGLMLPVSAINALRREALALLEQDLLALPRRRTAEPSPLPPAPQAPGAPLLTCSISRPEQLTDPLLECEMIYLPLELLDQVDWEAYAGRGRFCAVLPRIFRTKDEPVFRAKLQQYAPVLSAVAVGNLGHLPIVQGLGLEIRGDFGLNVFNARSLLFLQELGLESATVSFELRHQQVRDMNKYLPCEAIVYGRLPLMITENCIIGNSGSCSCQQDNDLVDRTGARFPLLPAYGHRCEIQNSQVLFLADKPQWQQLGLTYARLRFTTESPQACLTILRRYQGQNSWQPEHYTRGLFYRGVE